MDVEAGPPIETREDSSPSPSHHRVAVIGAGAMGLAAAYHALKKGHDVTVYEADSVPGGMAAHFDFDGLSIERFYHFVCKPDNDTFALMAELGIGDRMRWVSTKMGYFVDGQLYEWGNPIALLKFPRLNLIEKVRYGLMMFTSVKRSGPGKLDCMSAEEWIGRWCGRRVYDMLWRPLFELKFYEYASKISAAWMWTRIKRVGSSRRSMLEESLGYIDGGSQTLIDTLCSAITEAGGKIETAVPVEKVCVENGRISGIQIGGLTVPFDSVISTVPTPYVSRMVPDLPETSKVAYDAIENIGVVCVLLKLKKQVTPNFWVNVSDERMAIPGFVEFSNLRPLPDHVVYVPFYMPPSNPKFQASDEEFIQESFECMKHVNPGLTDDDLIASRVGRLRHAQPVCPPGFGQALPDIITPIAGLQIADTSYYYPEDRGISESVRYGKRMAESITAVVGANVD